MRRLIVAVSLFVFAASLNAAPRVVLLSIDAGSDVILDRLLASGVLRDGAFQRMARRGAVAASMTPASVSSTPVSHATLFTGAWPSMHGITGVAMPGTRLDGDLQSGFAAPTSVPRLWTVAQGPLRRHRHQRGGHRGGVRRARGAIRRLRFLGGEAGTRSDGLGPAHRLCPPHRRA